MRRREFMAGAGCTAACSLLPRLARGQAPPPMIYSRGYKPLSTAEFRSLPKAEPNRMVLPVSVDLSGRLPLPGDQGGLGSCVAWAVAYARTFYVAQYEGRDPRQPANIASPNYLYFLSRANACDDGRNFNEVAAVLKKGALSLADYPYATTCTTLPVSVVAKASDFQVLGIRGVDMASPEDIKGQIARGNPVLFSFNAVFDNFRGDGIYNQPIRNSDAGGHAMILVGYDDVRQAFRLLNSWGRSWGDGGYAWIAYDAVKGLATGGAVLIVTEPKQRARLCAPNRK
jgi:C1A family cysteine protease